MPSIPSRVHMPRIAKGGSCPEYQNQPIIKYQRLCQPLYCHAIGINFREAPSPIDYTKLWIVRIGNPKSFDYQWKRLQEHLSSTDGVDAVYETHHTSHGAERSLCYEQE